MKILEEAELKLLSFRIGAMSLDTYRLMHRDFDWRLDSWSFNYRMYEFGPAIGLLLLAPEQWQTSAVQHELNRMKGATLVEELKEGTIRERLAASNRLFNIVHVADSPETAFAEWRSWFCCYKCETLPSNGEDVLPYENADARLSRLVVSELQGQGYMQDRKIQPDRLLFHIRLRLLHGWLHSHRLNRQDAPTVALRLLRRTYLHACAQLRHVYNSRKERAIVLARARKDERELLDDLSLSAHLVSKTPMTYSSRCLSELLSTLELIRTVEDGRFVLQGLEYLWECLTDSHVYTSPLERYTITGTLMYPTHGIA